MNVMVIPAVKLVAKGATAMGLGRIVSGVVMTNTPIETKTQLFLVRFATIGVTSLLTKHVSDHVEEQIDTAVDMWKNRDEHLKVVMEAKDEAATAVENIVHNEVHPISES